MKKVGELYFKDSQNSGEKEEIAKSCYK